MTEKNLESLLESSSHSSLTARNLKQSSQVEAQPKFLSMKNKIFKELWLSAAWSLAVMVFVAALLFWQVTRLIRANNMVAHTDEVIGQAHYTQKLLIDLETGLRAYLPTGTPLFLEAYHKANKEIDPTFDQLRKLISDNPIQTRQLEVIYSTFEQWRYYSKRLISQSPLQIQQNQIEILKGEKQLMDQLRREIQKFVRTEHSLKGARSSQANQLAVITLLSCILATLGTGAIFPFYFRRRLLSVSHSYESALSEAENKNAAYQQSESRARLILEGVKDYAIFFMNPEGMIETWNRGAEKIKGYKAHEVIGQNYSMLFPKKDAEEKRPQRELRIALHEGHYEEDGLRRRKDGSTFWAHVVLTPIFDPQGKHIGFCKITQDLTDKKLIEENLRQSEMRYRLLVSEVKDYAIFMLDPQGYIMSWNIGGEIIKGYRPEEIIGRHFSQFYIPEDVDQGKPSHELKLAREYGRIEDEGWRTRKDGSRFWANVIMTAIYNNRHELIGFSKITRDITERKKVEEERTLLLGKLKEAVHARDEFLAICSHELNTPLTSMKLQLQSIGRSLGKTGVISKERLESLVRNSTNQLNQLSRIIEEMLDASRFHTGRIQFQFEEVNLSQLIYDVIEQFEKADAKLKDRIHSKIKDEVIVHADQRRIGQAVFNLINNAIKFGKGKPIEISLVTNQQKAEMIVRDSGIGISKEDLLRIFDPFERAVSVSQFGGLGLGLFLTKSIVETCGGVVRAESEAENGASFLVELPLSERTGPRRPGFRSDGGHNSDLITARVPESNAAKNGFESGIVAAMKSESELSLYN